MRTIPVTVEITQRRTMFLEVPDKYDYVDLVATVYKNGNIPINENWMLSDVKIEEETNAFNKNYIMVFFNYVIFKNDCYFDSSSFKSGY